MIANGRKQIAEVDLVKRGFRHRNSPRAPTLYLDRNYGNILVIRIGVPFP